jgi:DNA-binding transcriptional LysR family regulator
MTLPAPGNLSISELRSFLAVAQVGAISKAAATLGVTQPTLSWTIRRLEERFGTEFFIRSKQGVTLTRTGTLFSIRAHSLLRSFEQLEIDMRAEQETVRGRYSIGVYPTLAGHTLPQFLPQLLSGWPDLEISIGHGSSHLITNGVVELRYDLGIVVNPPQNPNLTIVNLYRDKVGLWGARGTNWKRGQKRVPIICNPEMPQVDSILNALYRKGWFSDCRLVHTTDLQVISELTAAHCGYGILPRSVAKQQKSAVLVPVLDGPWIDDQIALIWRGDSQKSRASLLIRDAIKTCLRK